MKLFSLLYGLTGSLIVGAGWVKLAVAEIVPDATLPQPSQVTSTGRRATITAGTRRGQTLFHSFREFSVGSGETASFQDVDSGIGNIFARVTGRNLSQINGAIEVLQSNSRISPANLFLLNPNGIIFGKNASLRIGGSFIATTAEAINFADGTQFSAVNPQSAPLLTVSTPVGLQFGNSAGRIVNRSETPLLDETGNPINDALENPISGLVGSPNQTFALVGNGITLANSKIVVDGGRIELGSVAENSQVTLTPIAQGWDLGYEGVENFADIRLFDADIDGTGSVGATIQLQARQVLLRDTSSIFTASASSIQPGGALEINATDSLVVQQSLLSTQTRGAGRAGNVVVSTPQLEIRTGGEVGSVTKGQGRGGNVHIRASESTTVTGFAPAADPSGGPNLSLIFAQSEGLGTAGNLTIETDRLQVRAGGQVSANTFGPGDAGNLIIRADTIELIGNALDANGRPILSSDGLPLSSGLFVGADFDSSGNGGRLTIETEQLTVREGAILQATTYSSGNAGNIDIRATESIEVSGTAGQSQLPARIAATSGGIQGFSTLKSRRATGRGGNLNLTTQRLTIEDRGIITVNSLNSDPRAAGAGTIRIQAEQISLNNQGQLNAQTESGDDAGIQLTGVDLLTLRRNSNISTSAGGRGDRGDGGDITIADTGLILNAPAENSDINADAGEGNGGNIDINAQGILGIAERAQQTLQSDITATSESGVNGEISISNPTLDPTQGIVELPSTVVDASRLIAQGCRAGNQAIAEELGEFVVTGRGGVPPSPTDLRSSIAVITDWATLESQSIPRETGLEQSTSVNVTPEINRPITEAQGWVVGKNGKVTLVANAPTVTPYSPDWRLPHCSS